MQALFSALAEAEEQQPYLHDSAVRRGTRGLAEYHLGDYGPAWNRCVPGRAGGLPLHLADSRVFAAAAAASLKIIPVITSLLSFSFIVWAFAILCKNPFLNPRS